MKKYLHIKNIMYLCPVKLILTWTKIKSIADLFLLDLPPMCPRYSYIHLKRLCFLYNNLLLHPVNIGEEEKKIRKKYRQELKLIDTDNSQINQTI